MIDERNEYQRALARVRVLRGFNVHMMVYVAVNLELVAIDWLTEPPGPTWSHYPLVNWAPRPGRPRSTAIRSSWMGRR